MIRWSAAPNATPPGNTETMGGANRRLVMKTILTRQPVSRTVIAHDTGLTAATVSRITRELITAGIVRESGAPPKSRGPGRRFVSLEVNPNGGYLLGLSLNAFQQQATLTDLSNTMLRQTALDIKDLTDADTVIDNIIAAMRELIDECRRRKLNLIGGAVAITGAIDPVGGVVRYAPALEWRDIALRARLEEALETPFAVESLPNALNLAETRFGVAVGARNVLLFNCALGVGASLYLDGGLVRSTDDTAGVAGNIRFPFGPPRHDMTLDDITAGRAIVAEIERCDPRDLSLSPHETARRLLQAIKKADMEACVEREITRRAGRALGNIVALYAGLIHPRQIIFAGPLANCRAYFNAVCQTLHSLRMPDSVFPELLRSAMSYRDATRWLAIHQHLVAADRGPGRTALAAIA